MGGTVVRTPEKRFTATNNVAVTEFAFDLMTKKANGEDEATTVKVITWRDLAERTVNEVKKGDIVLVEGRPQLNRYEIEGKRKTDLEIDASSVVNLSREMLGRGMPAGGQPTGNNPPTGASGGVGGYLPPRLKEPREIAPPAQRADDLDAIFASEDEIPF